MIIVFWNLKKNNNTSYVIKLLQEHNVNLAFFSEFDGLDIQAIETESDYTHVESQGVCEKLICFTNNCQAKIIREQGRYILLNVVYQNQQYNCAVVHMQDRWSDPDPNKRINLAGRIVNDLSNLEESTKCKKSFIIGDFNANPFDKEMIYPNSFNAVLFKSIIDTKETVVYDEITYRRFYNPTLNFLNEENQMYGSFYHSDPECIIWNSIDQIILRKDIIPKFSSILYLKKINGKSLINRKKPNSKISDHLPLLVTFNE